MSSVAPHEITLTDAQVIDGFHSFLQNGLAQAKAEKLLDPETLSSAEADLMICGPALCLYFAALRSKTTPPSVPMPKSATSGQPLVLSLATCPPTFQPLMRMWAHTVPQIQALAPQHQHDLARVICDRLPVAEPRSPEVPRIAADLRAVAIEISQRRTFQDRYADDLQVALDAGTAPATMAEKKLRATFKPPPGYDDSPVSSVGSSVNSSAYSSPARRSIDLPNPHSPRLQPNILPPQSATQLSPVSASFQPIPFPTASIPQSTTPQGAVPTASGSSAPHRARTPSLHPDNAPVIVAIRETLYAAIAEVIAESPFIIELLQQDPTRAYFAAVGLAIFNVSLYSITSTGTARAILGAEITLAQWPAPYQPLMMELASISVRAKEIAAEDDQKAIEAVLRGRRPREPRLDRLRRMLERGVEADDEEYERQSRAEAVAAAAASAAQQPPPPPPKETHERRSGERERLRKRDPAREQARRSLEDARRSAEHVRQHTPAPPPAPGPAPEAAPRRSLEGTTLEFANRINALALRMSRLPAFRDRKKELFAVLSGAR